MPSGEGEAVASAGRRDISQYKDSRQVSAIGCASNAMALSIPQTGQTCLILLYFEDCLSILAQ
jgi:hypothetical protein